MSKRQHTGICDNCYRLVADGERWCMRCAAFYDAKPDIPALGWSPPVRTVRDQRRVWVQAQARAEPMRSYGYGADSEVWPEGAPDVET